MSIASRIDRLESRLEPSGGKVVTIIVQPGETDAEATARYETENGPIHDPRGKVLRVMIRRFGDAPSPELAY